MHHCYFLNLCISKHIIRPRDGYPLPVAAWLGDGPWNIEFFTGHSLQVCGGYVVFIVINPSINKNLLYDVCSTAAYGQIVQEIKDILWGLSLTLKNRQGYLAHPYAMANSLPPPPDPSPNVYAHQMRIVTSNFPPL